MKPRWIGFEPPSVFFMPRPLPVRPAGLAVLAIDELEAVRLADLEGLAQGDAARSMNVSRPTFGRILAQARRKIAAALVNGQAFGIEGGVVRFHPSLGPPWRPGGHGYGPHRHGNGPWR